MKRRPPAELDAALERYAALIRRYHATLDLMSDEGLSRLDAYVDEARAYADVVAQLEPAPRRLLDVGSGVGLPGVPIAAALPDLTVELVERRRKRATFLRMATAAVRRSDVAVVADDVRTVDGPPVDVVTAQAVAPLAEVFDLVRHRVGDEVVLIARKGPTWREEIAALDAAMTARSEPLTAAADGPIDPAERPSATAVLAAVPLPRRGTLVAVRVRS